VLSPKRLILKSQVMQIDKNGLDAGGIATLWK